jgi:hypothetical protein
MAYLGLDGGQMSRYILYLKVANVEQLTHMKQSIDMELELRSKRNANNKKQVLQ